MDEDKKKHHKKKKIKKLSSSSEKSEKGITDPEIKSDIDRFHELHEKLQKKLDKLYDEAGITHKDVQRYLDDPSNYGEGEWEYFQARRKLFNESLMTRLDPNLIKTTAKKLKRQAGKKLRGRALGRKRKWIDMG